MEKLVSEFQEADETATNLSAFHGGQQLSSLPLECAINGTALLLRVIMVARLKRNKYVVLDNEPTKNKRRHPEAAAAPKEKGCCKVSIILRTAFADGCGRNFIDGSLGRPGAPVLAAVEEESEDERGNVFQSSFAVVLIWNRRNVILLAVSYLSEDFPNIRPFTLTGTVEVLKEIEKENINTKQSKLFRDGSLFGNGLGAAPSAMTYLLFPQQFPSEFSILATIKAALFLPRFLFSLYDANNRMLLGLKLGPGLITVHYGGQNDVTHDRTSHSFAVDLRRNEWHQIGISVTSTELIVTESCVKVGKAPLNGVPAASFDIFGAVYIGADESEGASKNFLGQVSQLTIVPDPAAVFEHCGRQIFFPSQRRTRQPSPPYVEGPRVSKEERETEASGSADNYVDQENGSEVDEEHGSGQVECSAQCLNGGKCVNISKCSCPSGWGGDDCSQAICNPPCENGGNCLSPGVCKCSPNYGGVSCQKAICKPSCLNGGICTAKRFKCKCRDGYFGKACEHRICTRYVTKQVSYLRPVTRARIKEYKVPCGILNIWKCTKSSLEPVLKADSIRNSFSKQISNQEYTCALLNGKVTSSNMTRCQ
eukprot:gene14782-5888_t